MSEGSQTQCRNELMTSVSIVSLSFRAACGRMTAGGFHPTRQSTLFATYLGRAHRFHDRSRLLLCLTLYTREETAKEARFFFPAFHIQVLIVIDLSRGELSALWVGRGWWRLVDVEPFVDD
jgi:hypothetical protein